MNYESLLDIESALSKKQYLKREIVYVFLSYFGRGLNFLDSVFVRFPVALKNIDFCKQLVSFEYRLEQCMWF